MIAAHVATQPVQSPDDQGVALPQVAHALGETRAIIAGTRHHVVEDLSRPSCGERLGLLFQSDG